MDWLGSRGPAQIAVMLEDWRKLGYSRFRDPNQDTLGQEIHKLRQAHIAENPENAEAAFIIFLDEEFPDSNTQRRTNHLSKLADLAGYLFNRRTRERVWLPAIEDLKADHLESLRFKGKLARAWLCLCFAFRVAATFAECLLPFIGPVIRLFRLK